MNLQDMFDDANLKRKFHTGSKGHTGKTHSEEACAKMSAARQKRIISDETRAKTSASLKGRIITEEARAKIGAANTGKTHSEEARAKMRVAALKRYAKND